MIYTIKIYCTKFNFMNFDEKYYKNVEFVEDLVKKMKIDKDPEMAHLFATIINHLVNYMNHEDASKIVKMIVDKYQKRTFYKLDIHVKFSDDNRLFQYKLGDFPYIENYHDIIEIKINEIIHRNKIWPLSHSNDMEVNENIQKIYLSEIPLPLRLTHLSLSQCNLYDLPMFPQFMININVSFNHIQKIHNLPSNLNELKCCYNDIDDLPELPKSLTILKCTANKRLKLPINLHEGIIELSCEAINISELPKLPDSIKRLSCGSNNLYYLPELPKSLTYLFCPNNNLIILPTLPPNIEFINCGHNKIVRLPKIPDSMNQVTCLFNKLISLLPLKKVIKIHAVGNPCFEEIKDKYCFSRKSYGVLSNAKWGSQFSKNSDGDIFESIRTIYFQDEEDKYKLIQVNKIETWFLDVKFNPKYKYCRDRLETEFNEIFTKLF